MATYKGEFGTDFKKNKILLNEVAIVRSKGLKNEIAGYITTHLKRELEEQKEKESLADQPETISQAEEMAEQLIS
jgi:small subunit ribosomal protein S17e